jgi:hypothetical protein
LTEPEDNGRSDTDRTEEGVSAVVVAQGKSAPVFEPGEHVLNLVALPKQGFAVCCGQSAGKRA